MNHNSIVYIHCEDCIHRDVCKYKEDMGIIRCSVEGTTIDDLQKDGSIKMSPLEKFNFVKCTNIDCKNYLGK